MIVPRGPEPRFVITIATEGDTLHVLPTRTNLSTMTTSLDYNFKDDSITTALKERSPRRPRRRHLPSPLATAFPTPHRRRPSP